MNEFKNFVDAFNDDDGFEISDSDEYKVSDGEVFVDEDGGDFWVRLDGTWHVYDILSKTISESSYSWDSLVCQFGPVWLVGAIDS